MNEEEGWGGEETLARKSRDSEKRPLIFHGFLFCKLTVCQPIAASNVNNRQSRFTQNVGTNLGLIQDVRLIYLSLIQVTFFFRITNKPMK